MVALLLQVAVKCHGRQVACWPWSWLCPRGTALALHHSGPFGSSWTTCLAMRTAPRRTHAERSSCPLTGCLPMGGVGLRWGLRGWMVVAHLLGRLLDELLVACTKVGLLPARVVNLQARMAGGACVGMLLPSWLRKHTSWRKGPQQQHAGAPDEAPRPKMLALIPEQHCWQQPLPSSCTSPAHLGV